MSDYTDKRKKLRAGGLRGVVDAAQIILGIYSEPNPAYVLGIDTSHWTGIVDWQKARASGIRFAIIKFLDGKNRTRYAEENYRGAADAGLLLGAYQWLRHHDEASPGGQARAFATMLKDHPIHLPPAVDYEWSPAGKRLNPGIDDLFGCVSPLMEACGKLPMIYTAAGYWNQYGSHSAYWASLPLWQAQYGSRADRLPPWVAWRIWQWTETGEGARYGVPADGERAVDLDYWCGTMADLRAWCNLEVA